MRSTTLGQILNSHDFGTKDMRTGVIPFPAAKGYGLTAKQKKSMHSEFTNLPDAMDTNRLTAMTDRAKSMVVRLFEDVAKFAQNPSEKVNLINALNKGISFGRERGLQLVTSLAKPEEKGIAISSKKAILNPLLNDNVAVTSGAVFV